MSAVQLPLNALGIICSVALSLQVTSARCSILQPDPASESVAAPTRTRCTDHGAIILSAERAQISDPSSVRLRA
ncbi:hypothetical protein DFH94DRAFT_783526 [Russula ochroleuca]|uniref:Secreted protein n=1 Tax=Russula ochroleuca TaxID=152965 RepID=A0A9P5JUM7_9AGAM|nr:hypothetical protein DFH94DRAFT_783526 [Russula ochroleuca]